MKPLYTMQAYKYRTGRMLRKTYIILGLLFLSGCGVIIIGEPPQPPPKDTASVSGQDIRLMIARFGPVIYLRGDEQYLMDDPEYVLDFGVSLSWGRVENPRSYNSFSIDSAIIFCCSLR